MQICLCLVSPAGDVRLSRDPWCRQPLPKLKENAIKQMAVIVSLSAKSSFCCFQGSFVYRRLCCTAEAYIVRKNLNTNLVNSWLVGWRGKERAMDCKCIQECCYSIGGQPCIHFVMTEYHFVRRQMRTENGDAQLCDDKSHRLLNWHCVLILNTFRHIPPCLTLRNSTFSPHSVFACFFKDLRTNSDYTALTDWFL